MSADFATALSRDNSVSVEQRVAAYNRLSTFEQQWIRALAFSNSDVGVMYSGDPQNTVPILMPRPTYAPVTADAVAKAAADGTVFVLSANEIPAYLSILSSLVGQDTGGAGLLGSAAVMMKLDNMQAAARDISAFARAAESLKGIVPFSCVQPPNPSVSGPTVAGYKFQCGCDIALLKDATSAVSLTPKGGTAGGLSAEGLVAGVREGLADDPVYGPALKPQDPAILDEALQAWDPLDGLVEGDSEGDAAAHSAEEGGYGPLSLDGEAEGAWAAIEPLL